MPAPAGLSCPRCGTEMNHHADKVDYSADPSDSEAADTDFVGVLAEFHTCPGCRFVVERPAARS